MDSEHPPTPDELEKLPLRGIGAYAVRAGHRLASAFTTSVEQRGLDRILSFATSTVSIQDIETMDAAAVLKCAARLYDAVDASGPKLTHGILVRALARVAHAVVQGARYPADMNRYVGFAARAAVAVVQSSQLLSGELERRAVLSAIRDFNVIVDVCSGRPPRQLGGPIDMSVDGPLGALWVTTNHPPQPDGGGISQSQR